MFRELIIMEKIIINIGDPNNAILDDTENCIVFRITNDLENDSVINKSANAMDMVNDVPNSNNDINNRYERNIPKINTYTDK